MDAYINKWGLDILILKNNEACINVLGGVFLKLLYDPC